MKKELYLFGAIALLALLVLLRYDSITGGVSIQCPEGFTLIGNYCVENECQKIKCVKEYNFIKRPDCVCVRYLDKVGCGIKGSEETMVKSPLCRRQGQLNKVCGSYNSVLDQCVENSRLVVS